MRIEYDDDGLAVINKVNAVLVEHCLAFKDDERPDQ